MQIDSASWMDSALFSAGFCLAAAGITLTQYFIDDQRSGNRMWNQQSIVPRSFWLIRKVTSLALIMGAALGFWIVGWWWIAVALAMALLGALLVNVLVLWNRRLFLVYALCLLGVTMMSWAQAPILKHWGVVP